MSRKPRNLPKSAIQSAPTPRPEAEIQADVDAVIKRAGETQYKIFVYEQDLAELNRHLVGLNNEAFKRRQLEAEAKAQPTQGTAE